MVTDPASLARVSQEERSSGEPKKQLPKPISEGSLSCVCEACFSSYPDKKELITKTCLCPQKHLAAERVSVLWSQQKSRLVHVRPVPMVAIPGRFISCNGLRCRGKHCTYAHNEEERLYWNFVLQEQRLHGKIHAIANYNFLEEHCFPY